MTSRSLERARGLARGSTESRQDFGVVFGLVLAYVAAGLFVDLSGIVPGMMSRTLWVWGYISTAFFVLIGIPIKIALENLTAVQAHVRARGPLRPGDRPRILVSAARTVVGSGIIGRVMPVAVLVPILLTVFGAWKAAIPVLNPFDWDEALHGIDVLLHGGQAPWEIIHPALGSPSVTRWIDRLYSLWLPLVPFVVTWQAWSPRSLLREQFFIAFTLCWIFLGTVLAVAFSSAGPVYYERVTGQGSPYAPLLLYLAEVHKVEGLGASLLQDRLWYSYLAQDLNPFTRISAMPSMHVAMTTLYTLVGWHTNRVLGVAFGMYTVVVLLGSVHLAWHYAVDGYLSLMLVPIIWWVAGKIARRREAVR